MKPNNFLSCSACTLLQRLSQDPYDLTTPGAISEDRLESCTFKTQDFIFNFAMQRLDQQVIQTLYDLAEERMLLKQMEMMQSGEVINYIEGFASENRPVLHTAMRAWTLDSAFSNHELALKAKKENEKLQKFLLDIQDHYENLVQIGIGGSELGPHALYNALSFCKSPKRNVFFVSNVDPDAAAAVLREIDLKKTLVLVVSKSGGTQETAVNEALFSHFFKEQGLEFNKHFIAVTSAGSPMDDRNKYLEVFHLWDSVGGRFSATSMVGAVALSFAFGWEVFLEVLKGAAHMDTIALSKERKHNIPLAAALISIWNRNFLGYSSVAVIPYSEALSRFPAHLQQCCMESNGKSITKDTGSNVTYQTSPVIWGEVGTNGQHSFFQCLHQGTDIIPVEFIGFIDNQYGVDLNIDGTTSSQKLLANMLAQSMALATGKKDENPNKYFHGNRPSFTLLAKKLTPHILGQLLSFYEHKIVFEGFCWGINSFDQEGVSLGKSLADKILSLMKTPSNKREPSDLGLLLKIFNI